MMKLTLKIGLVLAFFLLPAPPVEANDTSVKLSAAPHIPEEARELCEARVSERLDRFNVDRSDIRGTFYDAQRITSRSRIRVIRILAWVSLNSCKGNVIVDLSSHCTVRGTYTRGDCTLVEAEAW